MSEFAEQVQEWSQRIGIKWPVPTMTDEEKAAALLLLFVHKGFNNSVWGSKRLRYWGAFEENMTRAAYEDSGDTLASYIDTFARLMQAQMGRNELQRGIAIEIVWSSQAAETLECIRREPKMLKTLVRVLQQTLKGEYDRDEGEEEETEDEYD